MEIRYNLDSLGWFQFEWLVQSLLKAELGIGVESWGGRGDWGRDAYSVGPLPFPMRTVPADFATLIWPTCARLIWPTFID